MSDFLIQIVTQMWGYKYSHSYKASEMLSHSGNALEGRLQTIKETNPGDCYKRCGIKDNQVLR